MSIFDVQHNRIPNSIIWNKRNCLLPSLKISLDHTRIETLSGNLELRVYLDSDSFYVSLVNFLTIETKCIKDGWVLTLTNYCRLFYKSMYQNKVL